jgi:hypothetical protein
LKRISSKDGGIYERRFFGEKAVFDPARLRVFKQGDGYQNFRFCLDEVRREQEKVGWNPAVPSTHISQYLFEKVKADLAEEHRQKLRLYCAIGSRLDYFHGIDGFFELNDKIFTFDIKAGSGSAKTNINMVIRKQAGLYRYLRQVSRLIAGALEEK